MVKCTGKNRIVLAALTLWLVCALAITGGCKKEDQPEATQQKQAVVPQETEQISASKKVEIEKPGIQFLKLSIPSVLVVPGNNTLGKSREVLTVKQVGTE